MHTVGSSVIDLMKGWQARSKSPKAKSHAWFFLLEKKIILKNVQSREKIKTSAIHKPENGKPVISSYFFERIDHILGLSRRLCLKPENKILFGSNTGHI